MKYKDFYKQLLNEEFKDCVMAEVPPTETTDSDSIPVLMKVYEFIEQIPDDILYQEEGDDSMGKEKWPHITLLYGLEDGNEEAAKEILQKYEGKIKAKLGKVTKFNTDDFDVIKIEVTGDILNQINSELKELSHKNNFPDYKAHITLAYVKTGEGEDLLEYDGFDGLEIDVDKVIYSDNNKKHTRILEDYGCGGGYGGAAGGSIAATGWAATFNGTSQDPSKFSSETRNTRYSPMNGNTILGDAPYDNVSDGDLNVDGLDKDEIFVGLRYEMAKQMRPSKEKAKEIVVNNLKSNPKYYSKLQMLMPDIKVTQEEKVKQVGNIIDEMMRNRNRNSPAVNSVANEIVQAGIKERTSGRGIESISSIMRGMAKK